MGLLQIKGVDRQRAFTRAHFAHHYGARFVAMQRHPQKSCVGRPGWGTAYLPARRVAITIIPAAVWRWPAVHPV